jgi:hypothetical protein
VAVRPGRQRQGAAARARAARGGARGRALPPPGAQEDGQEGGGGQGARGWLHAAAPACPVLLAPPRALRSTNRPPRSQPPCTS